MMTTTMTMTMMTEICKTSFSTLLTLIASTVLQIHSGNGCQLY